MPARFGEHAEEGVKGSKIWRMGGAFGAQTLDTTRPRHAQAQAAAVPRARPEQEQANRIPVTDRVHIYRPQLLLRSYSFYSEEVGTGRLPGFSGRPHTPCTYGQQQLNLLGHKKRKSWAGAMLGKIREELEEEMGVGGRCDHISSHTCMKL